MGINYGALQIGNVRADRLSATPGVGASRLQFTLVWSLNPKREEIFSVFGTYARVSVAPDGSDTFAFLGHAMPEVAWADESRPGYPIDQSVMYHLALHADQLLALELQRKGHGLVFSLDLRGNVLGPHGIRQIDQSLQLRVTLSDWIRVINEAMATDYMLVGVDIPRQPPTHALAASADLVRRANEFLVRGEYDASVGECRRAMESVWKAGQLQEAARNARRALGGDRRSMTRLDRELALGEALMNFTHPAHHVGETGIADIFSRQDAALAVATTASLVSSLARLFR